MDAKPWYKSRTVWSGILSIVGAAGLAALGTFTPETSRAVACCAAGNVVLRALTSQPLGR